MILRIIDEDEAIIVMRVLINNGFTIQAQRIFCDGFEETIIEVKKSVEEL